MTNYVFLKLILFLFEPKSSQLFFYNKKSHAKDFYKKLSRRFKLV